MARLRHLVVVVPGIGGSALAGPPDGDPAGGGYALTPGRLARTLRDPGRLDLSRFPHLSPTGLVHDLALLPPLLTLPGYQRLYGLLRTGFDNVHIDTYRPPAMVDPRTDVLMFPYDFRRSVADASVRLAEAVDQALAGAPGRKVIVLAHSLGGLVARHWVACRDGWAALDPDQAPAVVPYFARGHATPTW